MTPRFENPPGPVDLAAVTLVFSGPNWRDYEAMRPEAQGHLRSGAWSAAAEEAANYYDQTNGLPMPDKADRATWPSALAILRAPSVGNKVLVAVAGQFGRGARYQRGRHLGEVSISVATVLPHGQFGSDRGLLAAEAITEHLLSKGGRAIYLTGPDAEPKHAGIMWPESSVARR